MSKDKLLIFTQCYIYGGSERLMKSIYNNPLINSKLDIHFAYGYYKSYKKSLNLDNLNSHCIFIPVYLLSNDNLFHRINLYFPKNLFRKFIKIPFFILQFLGLYSFWNYLCLFFLIKKINPNIVHINNGGYPASKNCNELTILLKFFPSIKVIYQINNRPSEKHKFIFSISDYLINKKVNKFLFHSEENKKLFIERGFNSNKIVYFPSYFHEEIKKNNVLNENSQKYFNICNVGFLTKRKGQIYLLNALLIISKIDINIYKQIKLYIVGDGEDYTILKCFINENKLEDRVILVGNSQYYLSFINECDLFILPSINNEDLPLVLISAMMLSKPIISTNIAGIRDLLTDQYDSILINNDTKYLAQKIATSIITIFLNQNIRSKISVNVKSTFTEKLSFDNYTQNILKLYLS